ncbi:hypothetical protein CI610_03286 [invertebrate metagenome]|uniref:Uncharacterized protein n=1 Tax=invertebrate metagenome TaxID=1711999 RepID=A0A2H9T3K0_9ZZZZ
MCVLGGCGVFVLSLLVIGWNFCRFIEETQRMSLFFSTKNGIDINVLCDIMPERLAEIRNILDSHHLRQPNFRLENMRISFFPSSIKLERSRY